MKFATIKDTKLNIHKSILIMSSALKKTLHGTRNTLLSFIDSILLRNNCGYVINFFKDFNEKCFHMKMSFKLQLKFLSHRVLPLIT